MPGQEEHPARPHGSRQQAGRKEQGLCADRFTYLIGGQEGNRKAQLHSISQIQTEKKGQPCRKSNGFTAVPEPETAEKGRQEYRAVQEKGIKDSLYYKEKK